MPALGVLLVGCAIQTHPDFKPPPAHSFDNPLTTSLRRLFVTSAEQHPDKSGFGVLDTGREAFALRTMLIDAAERTIDAQYYIWNSDTTGKLMALRLIDAAERGVRVRLLLDDLGVGGLDPQLLALNSHPNIEVRMYNPFHQGARSGVRKGLLLLVDFDRLNRRMHNKTFVVDASIAIVGGRNIGDEYFDADPEINFRDRDLMAVGPIVDQVSENFDVFWNSNWVYPIDMVTSRKLRATELETRYEALKTFANERAQLPYPMPERQLAAIAKRFEALVEELIWARADLFYDPPISSDTGFELNPGHHVAWQIMDLILRSKEEILIESAYLIPGDLALGTLAKLNAGGVEVRTLTNSLASNDVLMNHAGYARRRRQILQQGVKLYELRPDAACCRVLIGADDLCDGSTVFGLHSKSAVFDRKIVYVGSFNMNYRSAFLNSETIMVVYSPELAERIASDIEANLTPANSWRVVLDNQGKLSWLTSADGESKPMYRDPQTSLWQRIKSRFIAMFPLEKYY